MEPLIESPGFTGFSPTTLHSILTLAGFIDLRIYHGEAFDLWAIGVKPSGRGEPAPSIAEGSLIP